MYPRRWRFGSLARFVRRLAVVAALAAYLAATIGVPLPLASVKDLSQPFPCMDRPCGCMDAAQCWKGCCCFTDREKLVWAAAHGVEPPAFVVAAVLKSLARKSLARKSEAERNCCDHHASGQPHRVAHGTLPLGSKPTAWVIASAWRSCHGLVPTWSLSCAVMPPPVGVAWQFEWTEIGRVYPPFSDATTRAFPPPSPPPRA